MGRAVDVLVLGLVPAPGLADTADQRVAYVVDLAGLVAEDAGPHSVRVVRAQLGHEARVGDLCPGHLDGVGHTIVEGTLSIEGVDHASLQDDGDPTDSRLAHGSAQVAVEVGRRVGIRTIGRAGERPAADHDEKVDRVGQRVDVPGGLLRGHAGPWGQLVAAQSEGEHSSATDGRAHRAEHLACESQTVGSEGVGSLIGEPGVELTEDGGHAGIDFDAVEARVHGCLSGRAEALDQGGDVRLLHDHRHLAVDDVGHR